MSREIHVCDNFGHLLTATADLVARCHEPEHDATILFLNDRFAISSELAQRVGDLTKAEVLQTSDAESIESFATLPRFLPALLRRNVAIRSGRVTRASDWLPACLRATKRARTGYIYHPGFFLSKVVAGHCDTVVMRDSGYSNYVEHRVPFGRVIPRFAAGRNPFRQVWGEEPWIHRIEAVRPQDLPSPARKKATMLTVDMLLERLSQEDAKAVAQSFWTHDEPFPPMLRPSALILTQPIDRLGICTPAEKQVVYGRIASALARMGYSVVSKPHPTEPNAGLPAVPALPSTFPIEAWTWLGNEPFDLAISLNSASLSNPNVRFARRQIQVIEPERFYSRYWHEWEHDVETALENLRSHR